MEVVIVGTRTRGRQIADGLRKEVVQILVGQVARTAAGISEVSVTWSGLDQQQTITQNDEWSS